VSLGYGVTLRRSRAAADAASPVPAVAPGSVPSAAVPPGSVPSAAVPPGEAVR